MKSRVHVAVVAGKGGHATQSLRLVDLLGTADYRYTYIFDREDRVAEHQIRVPGPVYRLTRPSDVCDRRLVRDTGRFIRCVLQSARILLSTRPDAVITLGPAIAVPVSLVAKLVGARVIFIESASRTRSLSGTGRFMRYLADLFFVQWEDVLSVAPQRAIFAGRLL